MRGLARAGPGAGEVTGGPRSGVICIALPPARVGIGRAAAEGGAGPGSASPAGARSRQPAAAIVTVAGARAPPGKEVGAARPGAAVPSLPPPVPPLPVAIATTCAPAAVPTWAWHPRVLLEWRK